MTARPRAAGGKSQRRPISLFVVARCLLAGLSYADITAMTGWKKSTIRDLAKRVGFRLPMPSEAQLNSDLMTMALCESMAAQGFTQRKATSLLRIPRTVVEANWPQVAPIEKAGVTPDQVAIVSAMMDQGGSTQQSMMQLACVTRQQLLAIFRHIRRTA